MRGPLIGGLVSAVTLFAMVVAAGGIGDFEALRIIEAVIPTARFLASTAIGAGATVLALLLTLVGLSFTMDIAFHVRVYQEARVITTLAVIAILLGAAVLLAVTMPIGEVAEISSLYDVLYYVLAVAIAALGGVMAAIGLMISSTLRALITLADPDGSNEMLDQPDAAIRDEAD